MKRLSFQRSHRVSRPSGKKAINLTAMVEHIHNIEISDPLVAGNAIAFTMEMDMTMRGRALESSFQLV